MYNTLNLGEGKMLPYSSKIECRKSDDNIEIYIKDTTANMQEDVSNFESIAIAIWSVKRNIKIALKFDTYKGEKDKNEANKDKAWSMESLIQPCYTDKDGKIQPEPKRLHHMRFLYRVI